MSEQERDESANEDPSKSDSEGHERRPPLTAEQRRLLGIPRPVHERLEAEREIADEIAWRDIRPAEPHVGIRRPDGLPPRASKTWRAILVIGLLAALLGSFYVGKKFDYWRYLWSVRNKPKLGEGIPDKYPGVSSDELVERALVFERSGRWDEAAERFIAAKHKDLKYRGIFYHVGKLAYDKGNFDIADRLFDRAVAFGENIDLANYLRGVIATRRRDFAAADRYFQAATTTEPFAADYYYYWGEALRLDHRPKDAAARYEQAGRRARDDQDLTVCQFKTRMARLEGGEDEQLKAEIEEKRSAGPLPLDWLLTEAAIAVGDGRIDDAVRSVIAARTVIEKTENGGGIFLSCTKDALFQNACRKHPLLANACDVDVISR